jgi:calcineurin-like phosphoesterase family protein
MKRLKLADPEKVFFTSDLHFYHDNMIPICRRPFKDTEEMNQKLIDLYNEVVPKDGVCFILGDVSWKSPSWTQHLIDQLNGKKILITGNHDKSGTEGMFYQNYDMLQLLVMNEQGIYDDIHLCHFPLEEWNNYFHGSYHLHGHLHSPKDKVHTADLRLDVGIDGHDYKPWSWVEVKEFLNNNRKERRNGTISGND